MRFAESREQQDLFKWSRLMQHKYPELELLFSVPNGGNRDRVTATILKAEGVKAGVCDIHLPVPKGGYASLFIELKATDAANKNGTPSQREFIKKAIEWGNYARICVGMGEAVDTLEKYLRGELVKGETD